MSYGKSFTPGEILTAADVNNFLNPSTNQYTPQAVARGTVSLTIPANSQVASQSVTLPPDIFASTPTVMLTMTGGSGLEADIEPKTHNKSPDGFRVYAIARTKVTSARTVQIDWLAVS